MLIFGHVNKCLLKEALPKTSYPFARLTSIIDFAELTSTSSPKGVELTFSIQGENKDQKKVARGLAFKID